MKDELCILRWSDDGIPRKLIRLSKKKGRNMPEIGDINVIVGSPEEKRKIVDGVIEDVGEVFFMPKSKDIRYDFVSQMDSPEDIKYIYRAFVKRFGEDVVDGKV